MDTFPRQQHQRSERRLVHSRQQVRGGNDPGEEFVQPTFQSLHARPQAGIEVPEPLQNRRYVFEGEGNHGVDRHADRDFGQRRVHVPFPGENDPIEIPRTAGIDAEQKKTAGIGQEAGQQGHPHQRMQFLAAEHPRGNSHRECARSQRRQHHHVERLPDAPAVGIVHAADRTETGKLSISGERKRQHRHAQQKNKCPVDHGHAVHGHGSFPASLVDRRLACGCVA